MGPCCVSVLPVPVRREIMFKYLAPLSFLVTAHAAGSMIVMAGVGCVRAAPCRSKDVGAGNSAAEGLRGGYHCQAGLRGHRCGRPRPVSQMKQNQSSYPNLTPNRHRQPRFR